MSYPPPRPELLALLNAAKAEPDDDTPRLVLADWLQEQSDPADVARGEWLRCLVDANRLIPEDPRRPELVQRARELWEEHRVAWVVPLYQAGFEFPPDESAFRGGLLYPSAFGTELFQKKGQAVVGSEAFAWVGGLNFQRFTSLQMTKLLLSPVIESVTSLYFSSWVELRWTDFQKLAYSSRVGGLKTLHTHHARVGYQGGIALAKSPHLGGLRHLHLWNERLDDVGFKALCESEHLNELRSLVVPNCELSIHSARAFGEGTGLPALTELHLGGTNRIAGDGTLILVSHERTGRLKRLNLWSNDVGDYGTEAICRAGHMNRLTHLDLSSNLLTNRGAVALAGASHLGTLEELNLRRNNIAGEGALALANSPHLTKLRRLDLSANRIGVKAGDALRERFGTRLVLT
ncbi:MAG TPA: TIGR02996 domain-containing protein [Gemmataceae bacterium]|nr:TIGR02996 domain-containing protein [Gemmataceae bacterium]